MIDKSGPSERPRAASAKLTKKHDFVVAALVLMPEMVSRPLWGRSVYRRLPKRQWEKLRTEVLIETGGRCEICGVCQEKGMTCHEVWQYNDSDRTTMNGVPAIMGSIRR
jgi:hypothetical protein